MKVRPLNNRVLVRSEGKTKESKGGILLPDSTKEPLRHGVVIAVGPGEVDSACEGGRKPMGLKKGDRVLYSAYAHHEVPDAGDNIYIMGEVDILAVLEE